MIFEIDRDKTLYYRVWEPETRLRAKVIIVHGYAEHSGRYEHVGRYLSDNGFRVYAFDHPGHGKSSGRKALVTGIRDFAENLNHFIRFVRDDREKAKVFVIGHSMGGAVAAVYCAKFGCDISGIITSAAAVIPVPMLCRPLRAAAEILSGYVPGLGTVRLPSEKLSRDSAVVAKYREDPLNYNGRVKLKTAVELSRSLELVKNAAGKICEPILVLHGSKDNLAKPEGSRILYENAISQDKEFRIFEGLRHEILNEPEQNEVLDTIKTWLEKRL